MCNKQKASVKTKMHWIIVFTGIAAIVILIFYQCYQRYKWPWMNIVEWLWAVLAQFSLHDFVNFFNRLLSIGSIWYFSISGNIWTVFALFPNCKVCTKLFEQLTNSHQFFTVWLLIAIYSGMILCCFYHYFPWKLFQLFNGSL